MIIDYGQGGPRPYAGMDIIGFGSIFGWFGAPAASVYIATIHATVSAPDMITIETAPRIGAVPGTTDLTLTLTSSRITVSIEPASEDVTLEP